MARGLTIEIQGFDKCLDKLNRFKSAKLNAVANELKATAFDIEGKAKMKAPVDLGHLRPSIRVTRVTTKDADIEAQAGYSAYVEFGTGALVNVPAGLEEYAMQFKGKGVKKINLPAQPFLYPAVIQETKAFVERLKTILAKGN